MKEREVSEDEVKSALQNPDYIEPDIKERSNFFKFSNGRYLRITSKEEAEYILIITVTIRKKPFGGEGHEN